MKYNKDIIKLADKGAAIVLLNRQDYIREELRQLEVDEYDSPLAEDQTQKYNVEIFQVIKEATNHNIIDEICRRRSAINFPEYPNSTCYQKT